MNSQKPVFTNRQLTQLLWPLLTEQLLTILVGMVDVVMVASIGETAVSGVSLIDALNQLLIQFLAALTTGGAVVCAQFIGMRSMERARKGAGQLFLISVTGTSAVVLAFLLGGRHILMLMFGQVETAVMDNAYIYFMITALSFPFLALYTSGAALFRSMGDSKTPMKISIVMNGCNVVGNALCIYLLHMGVSGVAIPTLLSRALAAAAVLYYLHQPGVALGVRHLSDLKPDFIIIRKMLAIGIPGGIENSMFQLGKVMLQSLVSTLGTPAIAGYAVAGNLVTFLYLPGTSLGIGLTTIVGQCVGAGEAKQAKDYTTRMVWLNYAVLAVLATAMALARYLLIGIYNVSPEATEMAAILLLSHCIAMLIWPYAFVTPYALRAANDAKFTLYVSLIAMWVFRVAFAYLFVRVFHLGIVFVWIAMYLDWVFRNIVYIPRLRKMENRIQNLNLQ